MSPEINNNKGGITVNDLRIGDEVSVKINGSTSLHQNTSIPIDAVIATVIVAISRDGQNTVYHLTRGSFALYPVQQTNKSMVVIAKDIDLILNNDGCICVAITTDTTESNSRSYLDAHYQVTCRCNK